MMSQARAWVNEAIATTLLLKGRKCLWGGYDDFYNPETPSWRVWIIFSWLWWLTYLVIQLAAFSFYSVLFSQLFSDWLVGVYSPSILWWTQYIFGSIGAVILGTSLGMITTFLNLGVLYAGRPLRAIIGDDHDKLEYGDTFWTRCFVDIKIQISSPIDRVATHSSTANKFGPITLKLAAAVSTLLSTDRAEEWLGDTHEMVANVRKNSKFTGAPWWRLDIEMLILLRCVLMLKAITLSRNLDDLLPRKKK